MLKYRKLDDDYDYVFGKRNQFLYDRDAVGQAILTRLRLFLGEWWENTEDGLPMFQRILSTFRGEGDARDVDLIFSERINGTVGVVGITEYSSNFDPNTREYKADCKVDTEYGEVSLSIGFSDSKQPFVKVGVI